MKIYASSYENEYGEPWVFEYDYAKDMGVVRGLDVGWVNYPVLEGQTLSLTLDKGEEAWLESAWNDATSDLNDVGIYLGLNTEFVQSESCCWLTNDYCPLCLMQKREFEEHHCIWSSEGGTHDYVNLLGVCKTCHAILTWGSVEDRVPKDLAAFYHQVMYFGIGFFPRNSPNRGRHKERNFLEINPDWGKMIRDFDGLNEETQRRIDRAVMKLAQLKYQYFRDMGLGKWSWDDFEQREIKPYQDYLSSRLSLGELSSG